MSMKPDFTGSRQSDSNRRPADYKCRQRLIAMCAEDEATLLSLG